MSYTETYTETAIDRVPPYSAEAEQAVLAAVLADKDALVAVIGRLKTEHFCQPSHQLIYQACLELFRLGVAIDIVSVPEMLKDKGVLALAGGRAYLNELILSHVSTLGLDYWVDLVIDKSLARGVIHLAYDLLTSAYDLPGHEALVLAQKLALDLARNNDSVGDKTMPEVIDQALKAIDDRLYNRLPESSLLTGYPNLDTVIGGMHAGNLVVLAARPSMGKTALGLNLAANLAYREGKKVLFYSLEMSGEELGQRLIYSEAQATHDRPKLVEASQRIREGNLLIVERPRLGIPQLRASIIRKKLELGGLDFIAIDYLQLLDGEGENQNVRVSTLSRELKAIAREFNVPVLCLSQLSRGVEGRQDKRPMLSDLRDSGAIEQDADIVLLLYREDYYDRDTTRKSVTEVIVAKNRNGSIGMVELLFRPNFSKFVMGVSY